MKAVELFGGLVTFIDDVDLARVAQFRWRASRCGSGLYAIRTVVRDGRRTTVSMHRELIGAPTGTEVDHRNGNGLDNTRQNLRLATRGQNGCNVRNSKHQRSGAFKGVHFSRGAWEARICQTYLGRFANPEAAARAYDAAAAARFGFFAAPNFMPATVTADRCPPGGAKMAPLLRTRASRRSSL